MNPSNIEHGKKNPSIKSKKKPESEGLDNKEVEEEEEDKEDKITTALDSKEIPLVHIGTDTCNHSKQGIESVIPSETQMIQNQKLQMVLILPKKDQTKAFHKNFDIDANDQI